MKILYYLEPFYELNNPFVMETWLKWYHYIHQQLQSTVQNYYGKLLAFDALGLKTANAFEEQRVLLSQAELRGHWKYEGDVWQKLESGTIGPEAETRLTASIRERISDFTPEVVILMSESPWLRRLLPDATFLNIEVSWIHRAPYPNLWQLDPCGAGKGRTLAIHHEQILSHIDYGRLEKDFITSFKQMASRKIARDPLAVKTISELRRKYQEIILIPIAEPCPFGDDTPIFASLDKYLEHTNPDTCYIITQHPMAQGIKDGQADYLRLKYENLRIAGKGFQQIGTQPLIGHVDLIVGDFSTVALQGLIFDISIVSISNELSLNGQYLTTRNPLCQLAASSSQQEDIILYWLLTHYALPREKLFYGKWIADFIMNIDRLVKINMPWKLFTRPVHCIDDWHKSKWFNDQLPVKSRQIPMIHSTTRDVTSRESVVNAGNPDEFVVKASVSPPIHGAEEASPPGNSKDVRAIAFYLPQYHPIPENDAWWGEGFTEWTNVVRAQPLFDGHYQPHLPSTLGFYDLRLPEVRNAQADLAKEYGIYGFCYYHYWFNGRRLLERPFQEVLSSGEPDLPFCLCWANENWTRAWDGRQGEVLIEQNYCEEDDRKHIQWLLRVFRDKRYIRVDNRPFMLIYLSTRLPNVRRTVEIWREEAKKSGEGLYLCKVESAPYEYGNPGSDGFDACVEFQPDWGNLGPVKRRLPNGHVVFDYAEIVERMLNKPVPPYKRFPCVTPMWDNSPRRKQAALIIDNSTPDLYEKWLRTVVAKLEAHNLDENIVFINAWNEWGEGNHLEPGAKHGKAYLEATRNALLTQPKRQKVPTQDMVTIVILTFNQIKYTQKCVESIMKHTPEPHEVIFVDNGSTDGTLKWLKTLVAKHPNCRLIENKKNLGFSKGCNQGIEMASGEYILLLNNDVVVSANWLSGMLECLKSCSTTGIVGPMTNNISGPQKVGATGYGTMEAMHTYARDFRRRNRHRRIPMRRIVGFCMLFRRELTDRIGMLDERFGSGNFEDDDYCLRALLAGYKNIIAGDVFIHHYGSRTFIGNGIDYSAALSQNKRIYVDKWNSELTRENRVKLLVLNAMENAQNLHQLDEIDKAIDTLMEALRASPNSDELYLCLAEILVEIRQYDKALEVLNEMPTEDYCIRKLELTGLCKEGLNLFEEADLIADEMLCRQPDSASSLNFKGMTVCRQGDTKLAERFFEQAIQADPSLGEPYTNLGRLKWGNDEKGSALQLLERGFILSPTTGVIATSYHSAVTDLEEFERAEAIFEEAIALHTSNKRLKYLFIDVLLQQGKYERAMPVIQGMIADHGILDGMIEAALAVRERMEASELSTNGNAGKTLTVCMIVKNEEEHLAKCLKSVQPIADEIIVVDTGSSDRTKDLARVYGAKVHDFEWTNDFAEARNFSLSLASGKWILVLDADEVVSSVDHHALVDIVRKKGHKRVAYSFTTRNYINNVSIKGWQANDGRYGKEEAGTGWHPSIKVRLFPNDGRIRFEGHVHELLEPSLKAIGLKIKECNVPIHHYGQLNMEKTVSKGREYYLLGKAKLEAGKGDIQCLIELARQAAGLGEFNDSIELWQKVIDLNPQNAEAFLNMGYSYLELGRYEEALAASQRAMTLDPAMKEAVLNYSICELMIGDVALAIAALENLLKKSPEYPVAMGNLAVAYCINKEKDKGLEFLERIRKKGFDCTLTLSGHAKRFMAVGRTDYAVLLLEVALESNYVNSDVLKMLAECHRIRESAEDSRAQLTAAAAN